MGEFIVENVNWKKGETGLQHFILVESDGVTRRNGTGKTYIFSFWKKDAATIKGTGALSPSDPVQGEHNYTVVAGDTDTEEEYKGELIENPGGLRSDTFKVFVDESSIRP